MVPGRRYNVRYVLRTFRKGWWMIVPPVLFTGLLGAVIAKALPNVYYAQTTVVILPQRIPESYVRSTVTISLAERLFSTQQQVLSRTQLEPLITELDLFPILRARVPMEPLVIWFRAGVRIRMTSPDSFIVGYAGYDPQRVKAVVDRLTQMVIRESVKEREMLADSTSQFLETELQSVSRRLKEHEARVGEYKQKYSGQLPSQLEANLRLLQGTSLQLQQVSEALNRDRERRVPISQQLATLTAEPEAAPEEAEPVEEPALAGPVTLPAGPPGVQLRAARAMHQKMLVRLTPEHPDVQAVERIIAGLEKSEAARLARGTDVPPSAVPARTAQLREALRMLDDQIAARQAAERKLRDTVAMYQMRVDSVPEREAEYVQLTRDYNTLQAVYTGLLAKREESRIAANLERQQVGVQFRLVERPTVPTAPVSPNRPAILLMFLAVGFATGFGLIVIRELRDVGLHAEEEVIATLNLPLVGLVPTIVTAWDRRRIRRRRLLWSMAALALCAGMAALRWTR